MWSTGGGEGSTTLLNPRLTTASTIILFIIHLIIFYSLCKYTFTSTHYVYIIVIIVVSKWLMYGIQNDQLKNDLMMRYKLSLSVFQ